MQLAGPVTEAKKEVLRTRGVRLFDYLPQNAFLVVAPDPAALASMPGVLWAGPYHPAYRIEPLLGTAPTFDPEKARNETLHVRARIFDPRDRAAAAAAIESLGGSIDRTATDDPAGWSDAIYFAAPPRTILSVAAQAARERHQS